MKSYWYAIVQKKSNGSLGFVPFRETRIELESDAKLLCLCGFRLLEIRSVEVPEEELKENK